MQINACGIVLHAGVKRVDWCSMLMWDGMNDKQSG